MKTKKIEYSVVVPVYNEEESVKKLFGEIRKAMGEIGGGYEIIFIDDGSSDNTLEVLGKLKPIKILVFRRNRGQSSALDAGIKAARGKVIITMDGDGQNDPADIPILLKRLGNKVDVVCGWRYERKDSFDKRMVSLTARFLRKFFVDDGVHDAGCTLRVYKHECFEDLDLYGEMHRMIPALLKWRGFKVAEVKVNHRPRMKGVTKYNWQRTIKGFLDMTEVWFWREYESRPLHLFGFWGMMAIFLSSVLLLVLVLARLFFDYQLSNKIWPLVGMGGFLAGLQFLIFGLLANLIVKNGKRRVFYRVGGDGVGIWGINVILIN